MAVSLETVVRVRTHYLARGLRLINNKNRLVRQKFQAAPAAIRSGLKVDQTAPGGGFEQAASTEIDHVWCIAKTEIQTVPQA